MPCFRSTIKLLAVIALLPACAGTSRDEAADDAGLSGEIAYPFVDETRPLGRNGPDERFIIRSAVGDREYAIEIPGAARDFDVQVPLADLGEATSSGKTRPKSLPSPVTTDAELKAALPSLETARPTDTALLDGAFGTAPAGGPSQAPSYTMGLARVNDYFKERNLEYCLIEINALLAFYPTSSKLLKMKGTVLLKMRNYPLAELAWIKALELQPTDKALRRSLQRLQQKVAAAPVSAPESVPKPVLSTPPKPEGALGH